MKTKDIIAKEIRVGDTIYSKKETPRIPARFGVKKIEARGKYSIQITTTDGYVINVLAIHHFYLRLPELKSGDKTGKCKCGNEYIYPEAAGDPGECVECWNRQDRPQVEKISHGLTTEQTILTIWDRKNGEIFGVPEGIGREDLEEFFQELVEKIVEPECSDTLKCTDDSCEDCEGREGDDPK